MRAMIYLTCLALALVCAACEAIKPPDKRAAQIAKTSSPYQITRDFKQMLNAAQRDDSAAVLRMIEGYFLNAAEFEVLFGPKLGKTLWPKYRDVIMRDVRKEIVRILATRAKAGFTEMDLIRVSTVRPKDTTRGDLALMNALKKRPEMYTLRIRKKDAGLGLRLNGFVYVNNRWRSFFKTYDFLPKVAAKSTKTL